MALVLTAPDSIRAARLPAVRDIDLLIVLGGPMSANDAEQFPWLAAEKSLHSLGYP